MHFPLEILLFLFIVGLFAGFVDSIAGGGGMIALPTLLAFGIPPIASLATNKFQSTFGSFFASLYYVRHKYAELSKMKLMIILSFVGSMLGSFLMFNIDSGILKILIPLMTFCIGMYFLFSPNIGSVDKNKKMSVLFFSFTFVLAIAFYDGFFGPGAGSFFALTFVVFLGFNLTKATAHAKVLNFVSNLSSLIFYLFFAKIYYGAGLAMAFGQIIGASLGAKLAVKKGQKLIRFFIVLVSFAIFGKWMYGQF